MKIFKKFRRRKKICKPCPYAYACAACAEGMAVKCADCGVRV